MRVLHTADWQLGARAARAGARASDVRRMRMKAVEGVVELALAEAVDAVILAGDTFEDHDVDDGVVREAVRHLDRLAPIPVWVLPGNHDPLIAGGVWDRESWRRAGEHVHLLGEAREVEMEGGVALYPCPLTQKRSSRDPTGWIPAREAGDGRIRIGIAHGALGILPEGGQNFPIDPGRAEACGLDYLALGDWHGTLEHGSRVAYAGTPEATGFKEKDPGHVLVVEIDAAGAEPRLTRHRVGTLRWVTLAREVGDRTDVDALEREIEALGDAGTLLLRLELTLRPDAEEGVPARVDALCERLETDCFLLELHRDDAAWATGLEVDLPEGVLTRADEALRRIRDGAIPEGPGRAFASEPEGVVTESQALLHRLAARVGS